VKNPSTTPNIRPARPSAVRPLFGGKIEVEAEGAGTPVAAAVEDTPEEGAAVGKASESIVEEGFDVAVAALC
jgi:hypothetical protein